MRKNIISVSCCVCGGGPAGTVILRISSEDLPGVSAKYPFNLDILTVLGMPFIVSIFI
jgi:hypothetical protein